MISPRPEPIGGCTHGCTSRMSCWQCIEEDRAQASSVTSAAAKEPDGGAIHISIEALRERALAYLALAEKATPGPWRSVYNGDTILSVAVDYPRVQPQKCICVPAQWDRSDYPQGGANFDFIAASHEAAQVIRDFLAAPTSDLNSPTAGSAATGQVTSSAVAVAVGASAEAIAAWRKNSERYQALREVGVAVLGHEINGLTTWRCQEDLDRVADIEAAADAAQAAQPGAHK